MDVVKYLHGGTWYRVKHQVAETFANAGVAALVGTEAEAGLDLSTTTGAADMVGITLDTATYVTAQQTDGTTAERTVTVDVRPDAVIRAVLSGGATEGTQLTLHDVTAATTDGLDVTSGDDLSSGGTNYDDGSVWFYDGVNKGQLRKITTGGSTALTVTVAFEYDHAVGDNFIVAPFYPFDDQCATVTLTTNLYQVRADVATSTSAAELACVAIDARTIDNDGRTKSAVYLVSQSHWLNYPT